MREFPTDFTKKLLEVAIELHDKQKERADWWKVWLPFIAVIITVLATIFINSKKQSNNEIKVTYKDSILIISK